jgi:hypothetical protein
MLTRRLAAAAAQGARPILFAATAPQVHGGDYIGPAGRSGLGGPPARVRSSDRSHDPELARRLWQVSEEMTGVRFNLPAGTRSPRDSPETIRGSKSPHRAEIRQVVTRQVALQLIQLIFTRPFS